jgi:hypothetical protein
VEAEGGKNRETQVADCQAAPHAIWPLVRADHAPDRATRTAVEELETGEAETGVVQNRPILGYRGRAEAAGP